MLSENLFPRSRSSIITLLIELFTIGIHSSEQGAKAWFETFTMTAMLMACGYLAWYQAIFIMLVLIFGAMAAGMLVFLAPAYTRENNIPTNLAVTALKVTSEMKTKKVAFLTGKKLIKASNCQRKAIDKLMEKYPELLQKYPEIAEIFETIKQGEAKASNKADIEKQEHTWREQEKQKKREEYEQRLNEARARAGESSGYPPDPNNLKHPPNERCKIKITKNLTKNDPYKGIYYRPEDYDYQDYDADWWFETEVDVPKDKYRRPLKRGKGKGFRK